MTDFEIFSMVAMIFSLVLRAFQLGRSFGSGKKHKKECRHPTLIGRRLLQIQRGKPDQRRHPFLPLLYQILSPLPRGNFHQYLLSRAQGVPVGALLRQRKET